ncbi:uncharacterized protein PHACADRAFT_260741 [Phanerochaete carnosa HHB-10118-sp]|uniref:Uncharacterized protein n=1 Tax=Phanerochaete carnosa (strain HHB-10118-sp) TaxID=650164 RepID=K5VZZ3_PHACS|nr:uncharacterized protein PHACADRAFT_260741 [Phanerochaete carnosa HHB-10118-sp]EKM52395.1 hypothetical protein PHACADRAFT_260741 [Phanerochaete carnosa HHB-10118-sp]
MKSFAALSLFAVLALAQSPIPSGISAPCSSYLTQLDSDDSLSSCTSSLMSATQSFGPGGSGSSSASSVSSALDSLCGSSSSCSETAIRSTLANFYSACQAELTSNLNTDVLDIYDVFYTLVPMLGAVCSKDENGQYCTTEIAGSPPSASSLFSSNQQVVTPNFNTLQSSNAVFLFLSPNMSSTQLCTTCTRNTLTSFISFESDIAYAPGMPNSVLMSGQAPLYQAVQSKCGANFLNGAVQAAGSLSGSVIGQLGSGAAPRVSGAHTGGIAALLGAVTIAMVAL